MANPFIAMNEAAADTASEDLPYLEEYAWDFEHDCFRYDANGKHIIVTENEALKVWVYKCLKTERWLYNAYRHGIYNDRCNFGLWLERYIGKNPNNEKTASAIKKEVREAIAANPYVQSVDYIEIDKIDGADLILNMGLISVYGSMIINGVKVSM